MPWWSDQYQIVRLLLNISVSVNSEVVALNQATGRMNGMVVAMSINIVVSVSVRFRLRIFDTFIPAKSKFLAGTGPLLFLATTGYSSNFSG